MSIWQTLKRLQTGSQRRKKYHSILGEHLDLTSRDPAAQETRTQDEQAPAVSPSPNDRHLDDLYQRWLSLSPREQDVIALTCLGCTNRQIAFRLGITAGTVKSYIQNVLHKLDLHSKVDLRLTFYGWDFSAWK